jgi:UDP-N-acetylmuramoyl-tripeptide--D-alanyl-D-alanine ligase
MSQLGGDSLRALAGGRWLQRMPANIEPSGVGIDTRSELAGRIFVAIRGEHHDGHDFLPQAVEAGAVMAVVDREPERRALPESFGLLLVPETREALGRIALGYRRGLTGTRVVAITGSTGKTTTKRLIDAALSAAGSGSAAPKSFNNEIGVPLTILSARPSDRYLVVEIGANAPGEIARLARITEPDIAVITNIGRAHLAGFGDVDAVAREKISLLGNLRAGGLAVVNADDPRLSACGRAMKSVITFGTHDDANLRLTDRGREGERWWFEVNGRSRFHLALPGRHNALNALAAVAVARRFNVPDEMVDEALATVKPEAMRLTPRVIGDVVVYDDAYNANPDSMAAALETFAELAADAPRRIIVLGDMLELGDQGPVLHAEIRRLIGSIDRRCRLDRIVLVGPLVAAAASAISIPDNHQRIITVAEADDPSLRAIASIPEPGDAVLLKASRGLRFERITANLADRLAERDPTPALTATARMESA